MEKDYIPSRDADFDTWFNNLVEYVLARVMTGTPVWPHIPTAEAEALANAYTAWHTVYEVTLKPCTPQEKAEKRRARGAAEKDARLFVNRYLRYPPVTDEDRDNMGVPNRDTHPTPVPPPEDVPEVAVSTPLPRVLRFRRLGAKRWGKPEGVHGMELVWLIAEERPPETEALIHSAFATSSPLELSFKESERGKRVFFAARW